MSQPTPTAAAPVVADPSNRPKVGIAVVLHDGKGNIVMGERKGSHGAGTLHLPGGHLEHGESFSTCAARETLEETGLAVQSPRFLAATNDVMTGEGKHYVTVFVVAELDAAAGKTEPETLEPDKCAGWAWVPWREMWAWAGEQARADDEGRGAEVEKRMFLPLVNLWREFPGLENCLGK